MTALLRKSPLITAGGVIALLIVLVALAAPLIAPYPPDTIHPEMALQAPSLHHLFGTDQVGRDVFSRVIYGARVSPLVALLVLLFACAVGIPLGGSTAAKASASSSDGNARKTSVTRMMTSSPAPPKYPASTPSGMPTAHANSSTSSATSGDTRAP